MPSTTIDKKAKEKPCIVDSQSTADGSSIADTELSTQNNTEDTESPVSLLSYNSY